MVKKSTASTVQKEISRDDEVLLQNLRQFSEANGASGFEHEVAKLAMSKLQDYGEVYSDAMLNVYAQRKGNTGERLTVQLDAHLDEVGLIVQSIADNGLLRILPLGTWVPGNIPAHGFRVKTDHGYIKAISASKPPHFMSEAEKKAGITFEQIKLDIGARSKAEALAMGVRVAAPVVPDVAFSYDAEHDICMGKAFDCRMGCTAVVALMQELENKKLACDVVAALSTQEEIGGRGAEVTGNNVMADICIVFEGCPADDTFTAPEEQQTVIGKGPMLRHFDRSMVTHPAFQRYALDLAEQKNIMVQEAVRSGGGTNGGPIHVKGSGVPTIVIGIPVRYIHTSFGIAKKCDLKAGVELAREIILSLNDETFDKIVSYGLV